MAAHQLAPVLQHIRAIADPTPTADLGDAPLLNRFARHGDEAAFSELVRRHGPLVLGVCRRILGDVHAAEDAFQATFLLLARKANRLRRPDRLGPWLFGVARRVALKARTVTNRRREVPAVDVAASGPDDCTDLRPVLDDAIAHLPGRDRTPVLLCYFQGLTYTEAARVLRCPPGTVSARLARARARLRVLLTRRGVVPAAGAVAAALAPDCLAASVPVALRHAAIHSAVGAPIIPAGVLTLTKGVGTTMILNKVKLLAAVALLGTAGTGTWVYGPAAAQPPMKPSSTSPGQPAVGGDPKPAAETGRFQTANFIVTAPTADIAREFGEAAERERKAQAVLWLGAEMPPWPNRCPVHVKPTIGGSGGATQFNFDYRGNYEIISMDLEGDLTKMLASNLPHEIVHTVLADYFRRPVPRWADEGAAVLAESSDEQRHHDRLVRIYLKKGAALPVRRLLAMKEYGEVQDVMTIFAQGHSVARFLVARKDRAAFLKFVKAGMGGDWDNAAKTCYGFENVEALEAAWLADLDATRNDPGEALGTTLGALNKRADEAYLAKDFEKAIALWRDLQDRYPDSPDALYVNLRVGTAYWGIARLADEKSRADGKRIDEALAARRRDALLQARDSFQIIEQQMLAWQLAGGIVVAEDEEKLKRASFWGADVDFWLARYDMARSHYTALAIRYAGKPEEMIAWSQIRQCLVLMHQPEKANRVVGRMKERLTAIRFETAEQAIGTHKRKFWEEYLAETAKPLPTEMGPEPGR